MDRTELAKAYRNLAVTYIQLAEVLEGSDVVDDRPSQSINAEPTAEAPYASVYHAPDATVGQRAQGLTPLAATAPAVAPPAVPIAVCPAHGYAFKTNRRGTYCSGKGIDPAWTDQKGYCSITSANAAQYVAIHGGA